MLEKSSIKYGGEDFSLDHLNELRYFWAQLRKEEFQKAKQVTLDQMWGKNHAR